MTLESLGRYSINVALFCQHCLQWAGPQRGSACHWSWSELAVPQGLGHWQRGPQRPCHVGIKRECEAPPRLE